MKILIIITADLYIRNYVKTGVFSSIDNGNCFYIAPDTIGSKNILEKEDGFIGYYALDPEINVRHVELLNILMWRYRKRSKTFLYRFLSLYWPYTAQWSRDKKFKNPLRKVYRTIRALKYPVLGSKLVAGVLVPLLKRRLGINRDIERLLDQINPDLVIIPSSAYDPIGMDVVRLSKRVDCKTLFLIDNWDNISSKSILWARPDYLAVWGEQSRKFAIDIHGMAPEAVFNIGTPRFDNYFRTTTEDYISPYDFDYILLCGCAEPFDEITALKIIDREISENRNVYNSLKVVYRPHPKRQKRLCPDLFEENDFENVILDKQSREYYYHKIDKTYQPDLGYYPTLLFNAKLVIAPLTTMIIESLVCGKNVIVITYDDGFHFTSPHNTYKYYVHFHGVESIKGLFLCNNKEEFGTSVRKVFLHPTIEKSSIHSSLKYFLYHDALLYSERLKNFVDRMASQPHV